MQRIGQYIVSRRSDPEGRNNKSRKTDTKEIQAVIDVKIRSGFNYLGKRGVHKDGLQVVLAGLGEWRRGEASKDLNGMTDLVQNITRKVGCICIAICHHLIEWHILLAFFPRSSD